MMNGIEAPVVSTRTVTFYRATTTAVDVGVPAIVDGEVAAGLSAGGLLTYRPDLVSEISLVTGSILRGIQAIDVNGQPIDPADLDDLAKPLLMLRAEDGGFAQVLHEDLTIVTDTDRMSTAFARDITIGADAIQCFWSVNGASRRWRCPDWGIFLAANPADWPNGVPETTMAALSDLAARLSLLEP